MFFDSLFNAKPIERDANEQDKAEQAAKGLALYHYNSCPFCVITRRAIHRLNIPVEFRDIMADGKSREELLMEGGRTTVPCLRIEDEGQVRWMYESRDIIDYLDHRFE